MDEGPKQACRLLELVQAELTKFQRENGLEDILDFDLEIYAKKWFFITFTYIVE